MHRANSYPLKVWLTSVFLAPVIMLLFYNGIDARDILVIPVMMFCGWLLSLPSFGLLHFLTRYLSRFDTSNLVKKLQLTFAGAFLTYLPFLILDDFHPLLDIDLMSQTLFSAYCISIVLSIWIYKLPPVDESIKVFDCDF